jgi:alanine racemase
VSGHAWIRVDLGAIRHNYRQLRAFFGESVRLIPVVKGNAYGHGLQAVGRTLDREGAPMLVVTHVEEARLLRDAGIDCPILLLAPPRGEDAVEAVELEAHPCVMDESGVEELGKAASRVGRKVSVHLKVDTGMGRLGVRPAEAAPLARRVAASEWLLLEGVFSHCAEGWREPAVARQLRVFRDCCSAIQVEGIPPGIRHLAASAAALTLPDARLDAVRIGTLIFGQYPSPSLRQRFQKELDLRDTWRFCSRVIAVRTLMPGTSVGYGAEFQTSRVSRIAVVPVGLADGLGMLPESLNRGRFRGAVKSLLRPRFTLWATIRGQKAPVVGRVAMQMATLDVTDIPGVEIGDEVELPVRRLAADSSLERIYTDQ